MIEPIQKPAIAMSPQISPSTEAQRVARDLEAAFLAQMMTLAGVGKSSDAFGGGPGESHFSSFLVQEYAHQLAATGGIGLSEHIARAMVASEDH